MQELYIPASMGNLFGIYQHPEGAPALIILSHGFNGNHLGNQDYADFFTSRGFATFCLDFAVAERSPVPMAPSGTCPSSPKQRI